MTIDELLESTRELQAHSFDVDPAHLDDEAWADYVRDMTLAAIVELTEFLQETRWKPWKAEQGRPEGPDADVAAVEELVDVLHFLMNLFVAMSVDGEELETSYRAKHEINVDRQAGR